MDCTTDAGLCMRASEDRIGKETTESCGNFHAFGMTVVPVSYLLAVCDGSAHNRGLSDAGVQLS